MGNACREDRRKKKEEGSREREEREDNSPHLVLLALLPFSKKGEGSYLLCLLSPFLHLSDILCFVSTRREGLFAFFARLIFESLFE